MWNTKFISVLIVWLKDWHNNRFDSESVRNATFVSENTNARTQINNHIRMVRHIEYTEKKERGKEKESERMVVGLLSILHEYTNTSAKSPTSIWNPWFWPQQQIHVYTNCTVSVFVHCFVLLWIAFLCIFTVQFVRLKYDITHIRNISKIAKEKERK